MRVWCRIWRQRRAGGRSAWHKALEMRVKCFCLKQTMLILSDQLSSDSPPHGRGWMLGRLKKQFTQKRINHSQLIYDEFNIMQSITRFKAGLMSLCLVTRHLKNKTTVFHYLLTPLSFKFCMLIFTQGGFLCRTMALCETLFRNLAVKALKSHFPSLIFKPPCCIWLWHTQKPIAFSI